MPSWTSRSLTEPNWRPSASIESTSYLAEVMACKLVEKKQENDTTDDTSDKTIQLTRVHTAALENVTSGLLAAFAAAT